MKLVSAETGDAYTIGMVVEYLPGRRGQHIEWVKIVEIDKLLKTVTVRDCNGGLLLTSPEPLGLEFRSTAAQARKLLAQVEEERKAIVQKTSQVGKTETMFLVGLHALGSRAAHVTPTELDAILAGLRLLQTDLRVSENIPSSIHDIFTNNGAHGGLTIEEIDVLCERLN